MPTIDVVCPSCGAKLKAPGDRVGKKAKCKKCQSSFRIPGGPDSGSGAAGEALSTQGMPATVLDENGEVPMAEPVDDLPAPVATPTPAPTPVAARGVSSLPSADPFDFGQPVQARPAAATPVTEPAVAKPAPTPKPAPVPTPTPAPKAAKPAKAVAAAPAPTPLPKPSPTAKPSPTPAKPAAVLPAQPTTPAASAKGSHRVTPPPVKSTTTPPPAKPAPATEPLSLDDDSPPADNSSTEVGTKTATLEPDNPFAFSEPPGKPENAAAAKKPSSADEAEEEKPAKSKKRKGDEDEEERSARKRKDADAGEPAPRKKKAAEDEEPAERKKRVEGGERPAAKKRAADDEEEPPRKSRKKVSEGEEQPAASQAKAALPKDEPFNPFANFGEPEEPQKAEKKAKRQEDRSDREDEGGSVPRAERKSEQGPEEAGKPRYRRSGKSATGRAILITAVVGIVSLGLGITATVMFLKNKKEPELAKQENKEAAPALPAGADDTPPPKDEAKARDFNPKRGAEPKAEQASTSQAPKDAVAAPSAGRTALALTKPKTLNVEALPPKTQPADRTQAGMVLDSPFKNVKRVFPPSDPKTFDTYVLVQSSAGAGGAGGKLALDSYSPANRMRIAAARIEYDSDGLAEPIADLSSSAAGVFFLAAVGGKLHVWSIADKNKIADGISPYADKPEHAKAGLAAAFFAPNPKQVVLVSTAGAVLLYDLEAKKPLSEFIPPNGVAGKVLLGKSVAKAEGGASVVVAAAGVLYQVESAPGSKLVRKFDMGGDVGHSLGLAVSGTPGRILYTFDTIAEKPDQSEVAILALAAGEKSAPVYYRFPAIGAAKGALWAGSSAGVTATGGVLWFNDDEGKFSPLALTRPAGDGLYFADEQYFWYVIPHPKDANKSVLAALSMPFDDFTEYQKKAASGRVRSMLIDAEGLAK